jgi:hypothetical protein
MGKYMTGSALIFLFNAFQTLTPSAVQSEKTLKKYFQREVKNVAFFVITLLSSCLTGLALFRF